MIDGTTVAVALMALCSVDLVLIWQMWTRIDREHDIEHELRGVEIVLEHFMRKELEDDGEKD